MKFSIDNLCKMKTSVHDKILALRAQILYEQPYAPIHKKEIKKFFHINRITGIIYNTMQHMPKKIWLDDLRPEPEGWIRAYWPDQVIKMLQSVLSVVEISLDHDLGDDARGTGYDVLRWIEVQVALNGFIPPIINLHTANSSARIKMENAVKQIQKLHNQNMEKLNENM